MYIFPESPIPIYPLELSSEWKNLKSDFESGKEQRRQVWSFPKRSVKLEFKPLQQTEIDTLWNFFQARKGSLEPFWFFRPTKDKNGDWHSYTGEYVGRGDGATTIFELPSKDTQGVELITNGDFETGATSPWAFYVNTGVGAAATFTAQASSPYEGIYRGLATITNGGPVPSDIQIFQIDKSITAGKKQYIKFAAKGGGPRTIDIRIRKQASPWTDYTEEGIQTINLIDAWQVFDIEWTANITATDAKLQFDIGGSVVAFACDIISWWEEGASSPLTVYENGIKKNYTFSQGSGDAGVDRVTFDVAPANGSVITADLTGQLRLRSRFSNDQMSQELFEHVLYSTGIELTEVRV